MSWCLGNGQFLSFNYTYRDFVFTLPHGIKTLISFMFSLATCIRFHVTFSISFHFDTGLRECSVQEITHVEVSSVAFYYNLYINMERSNSFFPIYGAARIYLYHRETAPVGQDLLSKAYSRSHSVRHTTHFRTPLYE